MQRANALFQTVALKRGLWVALACLWVPVGWAQGAQAKASAKELEWPRTFTGQPDFAFTREEAQRDALIGSQGQGKPVPVFPTLQTLLKDERMLDPFGLQKRVGISATVAVSGSAAAPVAEPQAVSLMDRLMAGMNNLPELSVSTSLKTDEFRQTMWQTISATVTGWKPQPGKYSYRGLVQGLTLQAVVTSPQKYAIINGQRYGEGDVLQLVAPVRVPDAEIKKAMEAQVPPENSMPEASRKPYQETSAKVWDEFVKAREANPALGRQNLQIPVVVSRIESRRVILQVEAESHELAIRFAY